ncbi:unnamed protein product [Calypogeia fissa]
MAVLMAAGRGFAQGTSVLHEKVKFTVSVRGRQWSSARYVDETVEEFTRVIQRNARRLDFISENDRIQRLQLAKADGSEPEELDVDATLEDVIICMGDKRLVAIIIPSRSSPAPASTRREAERGLSSTTTALTSQSKLSNVQNHDSIPQTPHRYGLARSMPVLPVKEIPSGIPGLKPVPVLFKRRVASREPSLRRLQITIPTSDPNNPSSTTNFLDENGKLGATNFSGEHEALPRAVISKTSGPVSLISSKSTPSPAELAHFLVKGSSLPSNRSTTAVNDTGNLFCGNYLGNHASPARPGFHSFAAALLRRLPVIPSTGMVCGTPTENIASTLAQFLASHLRAVVPGNHNRLAQCPQGPGPHFPQKKIGSSHAPEEEGVPCKSEPQERQCSHTREKELDGAGVERGDCRYCAGNGPEEAAGIGSQARDKKDQSLPADAFVALGPSNGCPQGASMQGRSELIFFVNRRSKTAVGAHHLKLSDLSIYFHLSVVDAAKKLGVSQTTLKKACRKFGLKRWPGRKVRSLESTIHGLEHTIAVGQGAGMEQLTEAYIRSEVSKLQQEMDQLVHGTLAQQSTVTRSGDLYKRLYSRGWRSKYQSPLHDFDLNTDSQDNVNEHVLSSQEKNGCKEIKDSGVGIQKFIGNCAIGSDDKQKIVCNLMEKLAKDDTSLGVVESLTNQDTYCERSLKRPKLEVK